MYAASRDQVIRDIETKFTEYLRGHNQQVFNEINTLNRQLMYSTNEVTEYHAELMLASKEDEGATIRIEELERRGALAEHGARRIQARGLEIQEEYKDEVHHLQGLLGNTESRLQQMQHDSSLARSVAETLYKEGNEMQRNLESSIVEYRNQSELANFSHTHLEMTSQRQAFAVNELTDENQMLSEALTHSRKQAELYENNMEQITREYRKKINEANNAKLESDLRHRNTEHDTVKRFANYRNTTNLYLRSLSSSVLRIATWGRRPLPRNLGQFILQPDIRVYERSCEYLGELRDRDEKLVAKDAEISRLRKGLIDAELAIKSQESLNALPFSAGITSSGLSPYMIIGKLESEVEAANDESNILRA